MASGAQRASRGIYDNGQRLAGVGSGEGTSDDYLPREVPAMPAFSLQRAVSSTIRAYNMDYWTGTCYTTNRRVWEHDEKFKTYLRETRAMAIDMETATVFATGFYNEIPTGALLLILNYLIKLNALL